MAEIVKATVSKGGSFILIHDKHQTHITHKLVNDYMRNLLKDKKERFFEANFVDNNWQLVRPSDESW